MTEIIISGAELKKGLDQWMNYRRKSDVSQRLSKAILELASPIIEKKLSMVSKLPMFRGKRAFYDNESDAVLSKTRVLKGRKHLGHLKDKWDVALESGQGGHGKFLISNSKLVEGKGGQMLELHQLLWHGTAPYAITRPITIQEQEELGMLGISGGSNLIMQSKEMNFYNRYTGEMNWKRWERRGIEGDVVDTFQDYIYRIVDESIAEAAMILSEDERAKDEVKKGFE